MSGAEAKQVTDGSADTMRQRYAIAHYGHAARYPLCRAALSLWHLDVEWFELISASLTTDGVLEDCESNISKTKAVIAQLRRERKSKDANSARELLQKIIALRSEALRLRNTYRDGIPTMRTLREKAEEVFAKESLAAVRVPDFPAFKALERMRKRWQQPDNQPDYRACAILTLLRAKAVKQARDSGGAAAGYTESAFGSDRPLSDIHWPRLTANELHAHLVAMKAFSEGEEQLHQVRRLAKKLGIRLLKDKRGPKPKMEKPKKRRD